VFGESVPEFANFGLGESMADVLQKRATSIRAPSQLYPHWQLHTAATAPNGAIAERVDHNGSSGNVVAQIQSMIRAAKVVVADLSDSRPNVLHEVGFAEALEKPVIQICSTATSDLPFNVRNNQTIKYSIGQAAKLGKRLEAELKKMI
jgi:nucleoside 2-deoxyribosyltransferase